MTRQATARLFIALDPPAGVAAQLAGWARHSLRAPMRLLHPDTLHATILFLGSRPVGEIDDIGAALGRACAATSPIARLEVGAPLWLPPRRPRALAVELHDDPAGSLHALHAAVCAELSEDGGRFRPHITLARLHPRDAPRERALPPTPALAFGAERLTLYRSWLTPTNAEYEALESHSLAAL
jgi:2'-5' RNA ligase